MGKATREVRRNRTNKNPSCQPEATAGDAVQLYAPGLFLAKDGRKWVALGNSTCDAWVEGFSRKHRAVRWLRGKFEVGYKAKQRVRIKEAGELIVVARKQGVELDSEEADMILGYLEGHDYCLMTDDKGATVRHDEEITDISPEEVFG